MEGRPSRLSSINLARVVSIAGHPLLIVPLAVGAATRSWLWASLVAASTTLPLTFVVVRNVRRGRWADFDVSDRKERTGLYRAAVPLLGLAAAVLYLLDASESMMRGVAAAALMLLVGRLANRFLKVSLHLMFAAYCTMLVARVDPWLSLPLAALLPALAWSRRKLDRHTWAEIVAGFLIGAAAGVLAISA